MTFHCCEGKNFLVFRANILLTYSFLSEPPVDSNAADTGIVSEGEIAKASEQEEAGNGGCSANPKAAAPIPQIDGWDSWDDDNSDLESSCDDADGMPQFDGTADGFFVPDPMCEGGAVSFKRETVETTSLTVAHTSSVGGAASSAGAPENAQATKAAATAKSSLPRHLKRERSSSRDSSDGGDQPNKKKYQCHVCNKLFPNSFRLKTHVRIHTGEKPFKCEPCSQAFADRSNYVKHKQTRIHKSKVNPENVVVSTAPAPTHVFSHPLHEQRGQPSGSAEFVLVSNHIISLSLNYFFFFFDKHG